MIALSINSSHIFPLIPVIITLELMKIPMQKLHSREYSNHRWWKLGAIAILAILGLLGFAPAAIAHHPYGGQTPDSFWAGFLSGLAHPVIALDHLAFIVVSGLIAAGVARGILIPAAFVLTAMVGTGIHLLGFSLAAAEVGIAVSVVVFGGLLATRNSKAQPPVYVLAALAAIAGIFHGYAYAEAIVGAQMMPLLAYLAGFHAIQLAIASAAFAAGNDLLQKKPFSVTRFVGLAISAVGIVFFTTSLVG